jgi:HflK protein
MGPLGAAFTHQIASFLVMLNALRLLAAGPVRDRVTVATRLRGRFEGLIWRAKLWISRVEPAAWLLTIWLDRARYYRPVTVAAGLVFFLNGFYVLGPDEAGVISRFGRNVLPHHEPGLHYKLPWPVESLTRIQARRVRTIEIGFRSNAGVAETEPAAYEWNVQHRGGRFQRRPEESLMVSGDQNMTELTAVVHYRIKQPADFLFRHTDGTNLVRIATEGVLQSVITTTALDDALTANRRAVEARTRDLLQKRLDRYQAGVEALHVKLLDVHPSLEVVDAFREVSGAYEEKNRLINEAEGYRNEQVATARGNAAARVKNAIGYTAGRKNRAAGDASRFEAAESAFRAAPGPTETRLYLESMEQVLAGKRKMIIDARAGRRHLVLIEDGIEIGPATNPLLMAPNPPRIPVE